MRWLLLGLCLLGCGGGSTLGGPCSKACDCTSTATPLGCTGGEWQCNASSTCEFICPATCMGQVYTCPTQGPDCVNGFCSARKTCQ
jgi:hypothetical protein